MKKKDILDGVVERVDFPNRGILKIDEKRVVVKNCIPGQKVRFRVLKAGSKGSATGRLLEVLETSPLESEEKKCGIFPDCGGCLYQKVPYEEQLRIKKEQIERLLEPHFDEDTVFEGIKGSPECFGYRNKMEFSFGNAVKDGPLTLGLHRKGSTYDILTASDCALVHNDMRLVMNYTLEYCRERGFIHYNKIKHTGFLRFLLLRRSHATGELLACLVTTTENDHDFREWAEGLKKLPIEGSYAGILHAHCDNFADNVSADELHILEGQDYFTEELLGLKFKVSLFSFFQTNSAGAEILYSTVRDFVGNDHNKVLYDLYSGTGTIAQLMAERAGHVYGIELVDEAVEAAKVNAGLNGIDNCTFICGDVLKMLGEIPERPDYIILDPPREGVVPKSLSQIIDYNVPKMVYISCKASSLAADLVTLKAAGYRVEKWVLVDMFPHTQHVETVVLLSKGVINSQKVKVDFSLEDMDITSFRGKATYEQIKEYVLQQTGMKVSSLYISQVKRKCGLEVGDSYNKPKTEEAKQPQCPPEKEAAIMDALKHFGLI